mmetsp:Transcript_26896/g.78973  ORF Transcript_26896/g.78973 Transcript_26896/m.78973 type:complete len:326 (-) Transcript_26896:1035-2012(-)
MSQPSLAAASPLPLDSSPRRVDSGSAPGPLARGTAVEPAAPRCATRKATTVMSSGRPPPQRMSLSFARIAKGESTLLSRESSLARAAMASASCCGDAPVPDPSIRSSIVSSSASSSTLSKRPSVASTRMSPGRTGTRTREASCGVSKRSSGASPESGALPSWYGVLKARSCCGDRKAMCSFRPAAPMPAAESRVPRAGSTIELDPACRRSRRKPESPMFAARSSVLCGSSETRQAVEEPMRRESFILCHASRRTLAGSSSSSRLSLVHEFRDANIRPRAKAAGSMPPSHQEPTPSATPIMCGPRRKASSPPLSVLAGWGSSATAE